MTEGPSIKVPPLPEMAMAGGGENERPPTFADVAMRVVVDGPVYCIILSVTALAWRGTASTAEAVIAALAALLSKSWPRPVKMGMHAGLLFLVGAHLAWAW